MYGTPSADFEVGGTVEDEAGNPVEGIRAIVKYKRNMPESEWNGDTLYTDDKGRYYRDLGSLFPGSCDELKVVFEDIDGEENGGEYPDPVRIRSRGRTGFFCKKRGFRERRVWECYSTDMLTFGDPFAWSKYS